ncbi:hypothetical protein EEL30_15535 [Brevibacillus laterosporus]|uniref:Uncharacterized protein n=1 Tax=Brevibacillus laterosporus TaxID=1465 RepID=A0A518V9E3_BRELA|nr:hypothetical protein EEL30_15535 [Brevibacillus laterosporus]
MMTREEIGAIRERAEDATVVVPIQTEIGNSGYGMHNAVVNAYHTDEQFIIREDIPKLLAEIERLQTNWRRLKEYVEGWRDKAFADHEAIEGEGARYFYGGRSGALTNVQDMINALEWEGEEC